MNIFQRIKEIITPKSAGTYPEDNGQRFSIFDEYSSRDLHAMSSKSYAEFYRGRSFVAISTIANELGTLERQVVDKNEKVVKHEYENLIDFDLLVNIASYMKLAGACYVRKNKVAGKVKELLVLRPDRVKLVRDKNKVNLIGYKYQPGDNGQEVIFDKSEVMAFTNFSPTSPYPNNYEGYSDVQAIAIAIDTDYQASKRNRKYFHNNASVPGVLETEGDLSEDQVKSMQRQRDEKYRGTNNAHKIGILANGLKYKPMTANQKEMDFVESRRFNRDEILGFFKVPKAILGLGEGGTALNVKSFDQIFARRTILPMTKNVEQILNQELFDSDNTGYTFEFVNIIPHDQVEVRNDYLANGITLNEFRTSRGLKPMQGGDKLRAEVMVNIMGSIPTEDDPEPTDQEEVEPTPEEEKIMKLASKEDRIISKAVAKIVNQNTKGTDEYREKQRGQKIDRNNRYEEEYNQILQIIFNRQEKDITSQFKKRYKGNKAQTKEIKPLLNLAKWTVVYYELLKDSQKKLVNSEAMQALIQVNIGEPFNMTAGIEKKLKRNIEKFAGSIDRTTNEKIERVLTNVLDNGQTVEQGVEQLQGVFSELKTSRASAIVRTETIRAGNESSQLAREQSGVVTQKQRFTAMDERTCEFCGPLHGTIIGLETSFFDKGTNLQGVNENGDPVFMKLDYENVEHPPLHPNCRCAIIPVLQS